MDDKQPLLLPQISGALTWLESMITLISGPMLTVGMGIALIDLLTDGALQVNAPWILYLWAISQAIGVDGQLVGSAAKSARMAFEKRWPSFTFEILLTFALGYICFLAAIVFAFQETYHLTTTEALGRLGMDPVSWLWQRTGISVFLIVLSGWRRFVVKKQMTLQQELDEIDRQKQLTIAKQGLNAAKVKGILHTAKAGINAALNRPDTPEQTDTEPAPIDDQMIMETTVKPTMKPAGLERGFIAKDGLIAWAKKELGVDLSGDEATTILSTCKNAKKWTSAQGQPWIAPALAAYAATKRRYNVVSLDARKRA